MFPDQEMREDDGFQGSGGPAMGLGSALEVATVSI